MVQVSEAKKGLQYSQDLEDIINVLKLISSLEFSRLSTRMTKKNDVFKIELMNCFSLLSGALEDNVFLSKREDLPVCYILMCSDEGFLGEVNTRVVNAALASGINEDTNFIVTGERGERILKDSGRKCKCIPPVPNNISLFQIIELANYIIDGYKRSKFGTVKVIYMRYLSVTSHQIEFQNLLPCDELSGIIGKKKDVRELLIEPDVFYVMEYLVKSWLSENLFNIFWSSKLSEWAIRLLRLEHSSTELKEITKQYRFKYFKAVHNLNDKVIREIFAARETIR